MRRALIIVALLAFLVTWLAGARLPLLLAMALNAVVLLHLELVTIRRLTLSVAACLPGSTKSPAPLDPAPRLLVLVPCRNEAAVLPKTLLAWDEIDYPRARLQIVFIDDAGTDQTGPLLTQYAADRPWVKVCRKQSAPTGKGAALTAGLECADASTAVAIFDADARPRPDCLLRLTAHLANHAVAAVAGRMIPDEHSSPAAVYARLESSVHQRVTLTGAARLGATVPLLGSAYLVRRPLLQALGLDAAHRLEDIDFSMKLLARGFNIAFEPKAKCDHLPPARAAALTAQRTAWSRGFHRVAKQHLPALVNQADSGLLAIDRFLFALGYLDRLSLALAILLAVADATYWPMLWMPWWMVLVFIGVPLAQIPLAIFLDRWPWRQIVRVPPALVLAILDLFSELAALGADLFGRRQAWRKIPRAGEETDHV